MLDLSAKDYKILSVLKTDEYMCCNEITVMVGFDCIQRVSLLHEGKYVDTKPMQSVAFYKSTATYDSNNYEPIDFGNIILSKVGIIALSNYNDSRKKEKRSFILGLVGGFLLGIVASLIASLIYGLL